MRALKMHNSLRLTVVEAQAVLAELAYAQDKGPAPRELACHRNALISATIKLTKAIEIAKAPSKGDGGRFQERLKESRRVQEEQARRFAVEERKDLLLNPPPLRFPTGGGA